MADQDARDAAFTEFFTATWPRLYRAARSREDDPAVAEAALQSAFARAHASWRRVERADQPEAQVEQLLVEELESRRRRPEPASTSGGALVDAEPTGDVLRAVREGRDRRRRTRRAVTAGAGVLAVAVVAVGAVTVLGRGDTQPGPPPEPAVRSFPAVGDLDATRGLRAFTAPGDPVHLGGRRFDAGELPDLGAGAAATRDGMVLSADGRPYLLGIDGVIRALVTTSVDDDGGAFTPTARSQTDGRLAFTTMTGGVVTLWARDTPTDPDGPSTTVPCDEVCDSVVLDAFDRDIVFGHDDDGAFAWNSALHQWVSLGPASFRVTDARNGTVLYTGAAPQGTGAILGFSYVRTRDPDASLTFNGRWILDGSPTLTPIVALLPAGARPVVLDLPRRGAGEDREVQALDTDGSVLAAVSDGGPITAVYDCEVPSGACEEIGRLEGGDALFPGAQG